MEEVEDWGAAEVNNKCFGCMTCRALAPEIFLEVKEGSQASLRGEFSVAARGMRSKEEYQAVRQAIYLCPNKAIRFVRQPKVRGASSEKLFADFPKPIEDGVYFVGYDSSGTFGAMSYFIARADGQNILIDPPKPDPALIDAFDAMGGVKHLLFTHKDHTHSHQEWHDITGAPRLLHQGDIQWKKDLSPLAVTTDVEQQLTLRPGEAVPFAACPDLLVISTPGHTAGSLCFLYKDKFLFTGDSLGFSPAKGHLHAYRIECWQDWGLQKWSLQQLQRRDFVWVLPGHGDWHHFASAGDARASLELCIRWMGEQGHGHTHILRFLIWKGIRAKKSGNAWLYWLADNLVLPRGAKRCLPNAVLPSGYLYGLALVPVALLAVGWLALAPGARARAGL